MVKIDTNETINTMALQSIQVDTDVVEAIERGDDTQVAGKEAEM